MPPPPQSSQSPRWEYVVRRLPIDDRGLAQTLCLMGAEGWELVTSQPLLFSPSGRLSAFVFKREQRGNS